MQTHIYNFIGQHNTSIQTASNLREAPNNQALITRAHGNKIKILAFFMLTAYALIQARLWYFHYCIQHYCPWSLKIAAKLTNSKKISQTQAGNFLADLEKEKLILTSYTNFVELLKKLALLRIFYYDQQVYENIESRRDRLLYFKNRCLDQRAKSIAQKQNNPRGHSYV